MGLVLGSLFSLIGIFIVTRGMAFFSDFIAHSAILGGALALMAGVEPSVFLIPYSLIIAFSVSSVWNSFSLSRDTVLGVFYGATVAAGVILISIKGLGQQGLIRLLFGDILLVRHLDIALSAALLIAFALFLRFNLRGLLKSVFLPEISRAEGLRVKRYDGALVFMTALTIALGVKLTGVILANAMVVMPAASAKLLSRSFRQFLLIAPLMGMASFTGGIAASFYWNIPSGPAVIGAAFAFFLLSLAFRKG